VLRQSCVGDIFGTKAGPADTAAFAVVVVAEKWGQKNEFLSFCPHLSAHQTATRQPTNIVPVLSFCMKVFVANSLAPIFVPEIPNRVPLGSRPAARQYQFVPCEE
jgi:hypothetical protein